MNKTLLTILIVVLAICSTTSVFAVDLDDTQDFDGLFTMNVTGNDDFTQVNTPILKADYFYKNSNDTIFVLIYNQNIQTSVDMVSNGNMTIIGSAGTEGLAPADGYVYFFNATAEMKEEIGDYNFTSFAGLDNGEDNPISVFVCGNNPELVEEYINTVVFD